MNPDLPTSPLSTAATPVPKRRRWFLWGCGGLIALLLIIVATVAITIWWLQRPIKPVVLSVKEKAEVEQKIQLVNSAADNRASNAPSRDAAPKPELDRLYVAGGKELRLTERELNGLLNANTDLGKTVRLELGRDAINAYLAVPIPPDFPIGGGKMFRARGRFRISLGNDDAPYAVLEDVTVLGLSLPKAWLGGLKGENLLADAMGEHNGKPRMRGIKSLHIVPGAIVLEVGD
ncbi:MAG: hypothetical protein ABI042_01045 [Verrucomicrobiota bacterium]